MPAPELAVDWLQVAVARAFREPMQLERPVTVTGPSVIGHKPGMQWQGTTVKFRKKTVTGSDPPSKKGKGQASQVGGLE